MSTSRYHPSVASALDIAKQTTLLLHAAEALACATAELAEMNLQLDDKREHNPPQDHHDRRKNVRPARRKDTCVFQTQQQYTNAPSCPQELNDAFCFNWRATHHPLSVLAPLADAHLLRIETVFQDRSRMLRDYLGRLGALEASDCDHRSPRTTPVS